MIGDTWYNPLNIPIPEPKDSMYKTLNDRIALNKNAIDDSRAKFKGDILIVGSAIATIKVIIVIIIMIFSKTKGGPSNKYRLEK